VTVKAYHSALVGLALARLAMITLLVAGIPQLIVKDGWYFHHGGDQDLMFEAAQSIVAGQPVYTYVGAGMPLIMSFLIRLFQADAYGDIIVPLVLLSGFLLGTLSVFVMAALGLRLSGDRRVALLAAGVWTLLPYLIYLAFGIHPDAELFRDAYLPLLMWANGLTEGPSLFLYLLGLVLLLKGLDEGRRLPLLLAGLALGFASVIRIHTLAPVAVAFGLLALRRDWRSLAVALAGMVAGYSPQFWYSHGYSGSAINIPYIQNWFRIQPDGSLLLQLDNTPFAPQFFIANTLGIAGRHPVLAVAALAGGAVLLFGLVHFWRQHGWFKALLLFGSPAFTWLFHALTFVFSADPFRFSVPSFPLLTIIGAYTLVQLAGAAAPIRARFAPADKPLA
jgi:hypothetical protein